MPRPACATCDGGAIEIAVAVATHCCQVLRSTALRGLGVAVLVLATLFAWISLACSALHAAGLTGPVPKMIPTTITVALEKR